MQKKNISYSAEQNLRTLVVLAMGLLVLFLVFHKPWISWTALGVLLIAAFSDWLSAKVAWLWLKLAELLGKVNSRVLLSLVFFIFLVPLALVRRLFVRNALDLKRSAENTLYKTRNHRYIAEDLENPW